MQVQQELMSEMENGAGRIRERVSISFWKREVQLHFGTQMRRMQLEQVNGADTRLDSV